MREGESTVLDNSCLMFLSNMWFGSRHDSTKLAVLLVGNLGGTLETGRVLDYTSKRWVGQAPACQLHCCQPGAGPLGLSNDDCQVRRTTILLTVGVAT